jgi:hypothetical protein
MYRFGLFVLCLLISACPDAAIERDERGFEVDPPGEWLEGDLHVHATGASNDTGGDSWPEDIAQVAKERGLFFVVLTDHSNSTGSDVTTSDEDPALFNLGPEFVYWDRAAELSVPGEFLMISGNEVSPIGPNQDVSEPRGHTGCIPWDLEGFDVDTPFIDRPRGSVTGGDAMQQAIDRGCFSILNHPYTLAFWIAYDWTNLGYHGMEIFSGGGGGLDTFDLHGRDAWRCDLLAGRHVTPIAASDNHRVHKEAPGEILHPALGWPRTAVYARERTWPAIMEALADGEVALYEGESRVFLDGYNAEKNRASGASVRILRVRGQLDPEASSATLQLTRATVCDDPRPSVDSMPMVTELVLLDQDLASDETFDISVSIEGEPGVYSATLIPGTPTKLKGVRRAALSKAIVIP